MIQKIFSAINKTVKGLISAIFPKQCASCGEIIDEDEYLCEECFRKIERINPQKRCLKCGREKVDCLCKNRVFRFEAIIPIFENNGIAKNTYYRYKFARKIQYVGYFAQNMAIAMKTEYRDIVFDYICYVPSSVRSRSKRGYDHSEEIATQLSQITGIPVLYDILNCRNFVQSQHKSNYYERLRNVDGKYRIKQRITAENILLIDDIVTSGATLDECSKQLLKAGAEKIYCMTVLATIRHKKINNVNIEK